jgi:hypothetical protein
MLALIQHEIVTLGAALLIGVATGWWAFGQRGRAGPDRNGED